MGKAAELKAKVLDIIEKFILDLIPLKPVPARVKKTRVKKNRR